MNRITQLCRNHRQHIRLNISSALTRVGLNITLFNKLRTATHTFSNNVNYIDREFVISAKKIREF